MDDLHFTSLPSFSGKIIEISVSKTGKHGHAKAAITGIDIFTGKYNFLDYFYYNH